MFILRKVSFLFFGLMIYLLTACGGGGESARPPSVPTLTISGVAIDEPLQSTSVCAYDISSNNIRGQLMQSSDGQTACGLTNDKGEFVISGILTNSIPLLIRAKGATDSSSFYIDDMTNQPVQVSENDLLESIQLYDAQPSENVINTNVTILTHMSSCLAKFYVNDRGMPIDQAINQSQKDIKTWIGLEDESLRLHQITPALISTVNDTNNAKFTDSLKYGYALAGVSAMVLKFFQAEERDIDSKQNAFTSMNFAQIACDDLSDGKLDGQKKTSNGSSPLSMGSYVFNENTYRQEWGLGILNATQYFNNRNTNTSSAVYQFANQLGTSTSSLFDNNDNLGELDRSLALARPGVNILVTDGTSPSPTNITDEQKATVINIATEFLLKE